MNALFDEACKEIQAAGVVFKIPADLPALNRLSTLADRVDGRGFQDATSAILQPSLRVGNVTLQRLTLGAESFMRESVIPWFEDDQDGQRIEIATAYVLAHARTPEADLIPFQTDRAGFCLRLRQWRREINATWQELTAGVDRFMAMERQIAIESTEGDGGPARFGSLIECLCRDYGQTPAHWIWTATLAEIDTILGARQAKAVAESQNRGPVKGEAPDPDRPDLSALRQFRQAVQAFKDRKAA